MRWWYHIPMIHGIASSNAPARVQTCVILPTRLLFRNNDAYEMLTFNFSLATQPEQLRHSDNSQPRTYELVSGVKTVT
jgi:hypothetical protein